MRVVGANMFVWPAEVFPPEKLNNPSSNEDVRPYRVLVDFPYDVDSLHQVLTKIFSRGPQPVVC